jgi:hypothetical protein
MNNAKSRRASVRVPAARSEAKSSGKAKWIIAVIVLLLLAAAAWALMPGQDPALARIHELRGQMENATPEQRRELFGKMREESRNLSDDARRQLRDEWRQRSEVREQKFLNDFFALPRDQQIAKIDEDLREDEQRRQERAARRTREGNGQGPGQAGRRGGGGDRASRAGRDSLERRKGYLDSTSPQTRAQRSEYRRMREERRERLGLTRR